MPTSEANALSVQAPGMEPMVLRWQATPPSPVAPCTLAQRAGKEKKREMQQSRSQQKASSRSKLQLLQTLDVEYGRNPE